MRIKILAIDAGTERSGWVLGEFEGTRHLRINGSENKTTATNCGCGNDDNDAVLHLVECSDFNVLALERFVHYGRGNPIGESTISSILWNGRFHQQALSSPSTDNRTVVYYKRHDVRRALAIKGSINDSAVRAALLAQYGEKGTKKQPGPLYGISGHAWQALGLAATHMWEVSYGQE